MDQEAPRKPGTFLPGHDPRRTSHRHKGSRNKLPADVRKDFIAGFAAHGFDGKGKDGLVGYARFLAGKHPKAAAKIVEKILPLNITGTGLPGNSIGTVNIVSVPSGRFLSEEDATRYRNGVSYGSPPETFEPLQLEHTASETSPVEPAPASDGQDLSSRAVLEAKLATMDTKTLLAIAGIEDDADA